MGTGTWQPPAGGSSRSRAASVAAPPLAPPDALLRPGILAAMIAPDAPLPEPSRGWPLAGPFAAAAAGVATAWFLAVAVHDAGVATAFAARGGLGWWASAVAAVAGGFGAAMGRRDVGAAVAAGLVAVVGGLAAATSALLPTAFVLLAPGIGFAFVATARAAPWSIASAAGAGLLAWLLVAWLAAGPTLVAMAVLAAVVAASRVPRCDRPGGPRRPFATALTAAVVLAVLVVVAPSWSGRSVGTALAVAATIGAISSLAARHLRIALATSGTAVASAFLLASAVGGDAIVVLARDPAHAVVYARGAHELRLVADGRIVDAHGPERSEAALAVALVQALAQPGDRVLVAGLGNGVVAGELHALGTHVVDAVDGRRLAANLRNRLLADGPVAGSSPPLALPRVRSGDLAESLAALAAGSRQVVVLGEPLAAASAALTPAIQHELRAVAGAGLVLQVVALDRCPPPALHALFTAAATAHAWNGLFVVGDGAVLLSAGAAPAWERVPPLQAWSDDARWLAHRAHLGSVADFQRALLGTLATSAPAAADGGDDAGTGRAGALDVVRRWLVPAVPVASPEPSLLQRWQAVQAELRAAALALARLPDDATGRHAAQALAARFLHLGAPRAELQAALGLAAVDGTTLRSPASAARAAHALDPTVFTAGIAVLGTLPVPRQSTGPLEDLARLPAVDRLAVVSAGDDPFAIALRARYPSACARAFVAALARQPLPPAACQALRELADVFVLREAAAVLAPAGRLRELLGLWRGDLPMPEALHDLVRQGADERRLLAAALRGRRDPAAYGALADLLLAPEAAVRALAAEALPPQVPYDPDWPQSDRAAAAERLRALHNRAP